MTTERERLERILGPADQFVVTADNKNDVIKWAKVCGYRSPEQPGVPPTFLTNVELANLYHEFGPEQIDYPPPIPNTDNAFARLVRHVEQTGFAPTNVNEVAQIVDAANEVFLTKVAALIDSVKPTVSIDIVHAGGLVQTLTGLQHCQTPEIIQIASMAHPIMMVGPAGCGKTTIAQKTAEALQLPFYITSTVFDTHELMGFVDGHGHYHRTPFREAFEFGGVWVADEIDAWDASALLAANSALANGYVSFPDSSSPVNRHGDFRMIACANTFGKGADRLYVGRTQLDAASLDRYAVVEIDYDNALEMALCPNPTWFNYVLAIRHQVEEKGIRHVVSTRAMIKGAEALVIGMKWDRICEIYVFKGMSDSDRKKIT